MDLVIRFGKELNLTDSEFRLILTVRSYQWKDELPFPSNLTVAKLMGCSVRKIQRISEGLISRGLLKRIMGGRKPYWDFKMLFEELARKNVTTPNKSLTQPNLGITTPRLTLENNKKEEDKLKRNSYDNIFKDSDEERQFKYLIEKYHKRSLGAQYVINEQRLLQARKIRDSFLYEPPANPMVKKNTKIDFVYNMRVQFLDLFLELPEFDPENLDLD